MKSLLSLESEKDTKGLVSGPDMLIIAGKPRRLLVPDCLYDSEKKYLQPFLDMCGGEIVLVENEWGKVIWLSTTSENNKEKSNVNKILFKKFR